MTLLTVVACVGDRTPAPSAPAGPPSQAAAPTGTGAPATGVAIAGSPAAGAADATSVDQRAQDLMWALWLPPSSGGDFFDAVNVSAVRSAGDLGYPGLVPPLVEVSRFAFTEQGTVAIAEALRKLTGEDLGSDFEPWYSWLGRRPQHPVLPDYARWKGLMLARVDNRFTEFFYRGVPARVPLSGAVWGGVSVDGIPPLNDPLFVGATEADYLLDDDVVLGVELNGDVRAYPHRILAWHEMSNDVVGGRPVTLVY
jgi:hypothetical protein